MVPAWNLTGEPTTSPVVVKPNERTVVKALPGQVAGGLAIGLRDFELTIADRISLEIAHQPERGTGAWSWLPVPPERYWTAAAGPNGEPGVFAIIPPGEYKLRLKIKKSEEAMSSAWILDSAVSVVAGKTSEITMKRAALDSW